MFTDRLKMNSIAEAVKKVMNDGMKDEESGLRMAAHAAHREGKKRFFFQGKTYPVKIQGEEVSAGDPLSEDREEGHEDEAQDKKLCRDVAKKEVERHEKRRHGSSGDVAKHVKKMHKEEHDIVESSPSMPLRGHPYHTKSDAELKYIQKDAHEAAKAMKGHDSKSESKYLDQHNDASTILHYRSKGGQQLRKEDTFKDRLIEAAYAKKSPMMDEDDSKMSPEQKKKKEKIVLSMKDKEKEFKAKYGKNWKNVMYATATKLAMKEEVELDEANKESEKDFIARQERLVAAAAQTAKDPARLARLSKIPGYTAAMDLAKKTTQKEEVELDEEGSHEGRYSKGDKVIAHSSLTGPREGVVTQVTHDGQRVKVKHGTGSKSISFSYPPHKLKKQTNEELEELDEKNKSHTHAAHYENDKGEWTGMNLLVAKDDEDAIRQAHAKCKEGCRLSRVERHIPVKEEVEQIDEVGNTEKGRQALTRLIGARVQDPKGKHGLEGVKRALKRLGPGRRLKTEANEPPFDPDKKKTPVDVTDKSGAHHSAMSRVRHLAKQALSKQNKMKKEMLGKAGMTSEETNED